MYYKIEHGSVNLQGNTILEDINFVINDNEKIGIVGRNGSGKSTLLKSIIGEIGLEDGYDKLNIEQVGNFKIGYVKQNTENNLNQTLINYIKESFNDLIDIENQLNELEQKMINNYNEKIITKYNNLMSNYNYKGGYTYKKQIEIILKKFGFNELDKQKKLNEFSGGQLTKISLIKLLLSKPDLLILDEPTNHLDIDTIEWLEEYLKNYTKSIIIVSHDRMFLDNICNVIYDIEYGTLKRYNGNYTYFINKKKEDYDKQLKSYEIQQKEIERLQKIADRFRYKPSKASMAMSKLKQIEKMEKIDKPRKENTKTFNINFNPIQESYKDVLKVKNLSIGYENILSTVSFNLIKGDCLGIIGKNGSGKSTLLKTLLGNINPISGKYIFQDKVNIGYFSQSLDNINENNTIYEEIDKDNPQMSPNEIRTLLGSFEFYKDDVFKKISTLSGGEKVRVSMCKILNKKPNVLILDEPTNHLDIISKNTIEKLLKNYRGTIILVSHDRYLINNICNKLLVFNEKQTKIYDGYQDYLEKKSPIENVENIKFKKVNTLNVNVKKSNNIKTLENKIEKLENKVSDLKQELLKPEVYMDMFISNKIQKEIEEKEKEIDKLTIEWESMIY